MTKVYGFSPSQKTRSFPDGAPRRESYGSDADYFRAEGKYTSEWRAGYRCRGCDDGGCPQCGLVRPAAAAESDEEDLSRAYKVGESSGLGEAAALLMSQATELFSRGKDDEARRLRALAQEIKKKSEERHPGAPEIGKRDGK